MPFELGIQVWKIMSFRWRPSSCMQFSILRLKSSIAQANSCWSTVSTSCRMASFNSFKLRGLWVYTRPFRYPQRKKSHDDKLGDLGGHGTSPKREMTRPGNMFVIMWFLPLGVPEGPGVHSQSAMCHGPQGLLTYHVSSSSAGTWRAVCTLTNPVIWTSWRTPSGKKCSRSINNCWPERWTISSGGLKTAFKRMVVT